MTQEELRAFSHVTRAAGPAVQARINALMIGQKMQDLPEELWHESFRYYVKQDPNRKGGPNLRLIRLDPGRPSLTVTAYIYNKFVHPWEDRFITPREAARLQDFPDEFIFPGSLTSAQRQIGNAVPVRLAGAVAAAILEHAAEHGSLGDCLASGDGRIPALSLFSGVGGLDLGFGRWVREDHGVSFDPVAYVEVDPDCCATLSRNFGTTVAPIDICSIDRPLSFLRHQSGLGFVPIIIGGPPCQAFSQAGRQKADDDARGRLVYAYLRFVEELRPTYFVMENVSNMKGVAGGHLFAGLLSQMRGMGYHVSPMKLCAAHYGTAQWRWRWFIVGVRDLYPPVDAPVVTHHDPSAASLLTRQTKPLRTVGNAFAGLPRLAPAPAFVA